MADQRFRRTPSGTALVCIGAWRSVDERLNIVAWPVHSRAANTTRMGETHMTGPTTTSTIDEPITGSSISGEGESTHPLAEAGQQATENAGHLASRAADLGLQQADRGREQAANGIEHVAESIRRITADMQTEQPAIANAAETAADQAERVATYLREHDAREILGNVENFARRQPLLFLGGAFVLGMAASRFIKAATADQGAELAEDRARGPAGYRWRSVTAANPDAYEAIGPGTRNRSEGS
jgi:hypothetical protein